MILIIITWWKGLVKDILYCLLSKNVIASCSDDDDEFYDRTKKKPSTRKSGEEKLVETADTLLNKKEAIINEMEKMKELLIKEEEKLEPNNENNTEGADDLDAYMSGLSSQLGEDLDIHLTKFSQLQFN